MSLPISACLISKAAFGDPVAFTELVQRMHKNLKCGHFTLGGCSHKPQCPIPSEQAMHALDHKVFEALSALEQKVKPSAQKQKPC